MHLLKLTISVNYDPGLDQGFDYYEVKLKLH